MLRRKRPTSAVILLVAAVVFLGSCNAFAKNPCAGSRKGIVVKGSFALRQLAYQNRTVDSSPQRVCERIHRLAGVARQKEEALLGRPSVYVDISSTVAHYQGEVVMVTGAAGSMGRTLSRYLAECAPARILFIDKDTAALQDLAAKLRAEYPGVPLVFLPYDTADRNAMAHIFQRYKPSSLFHAAANKYNDKLEDPDFQIEGATSNIAGTNVLATLAIEHGVKDFVFFSSDKAVSPSTFYAASKRAGEMMMASYAGRGPKFITVRPANFLGSDGSVVPIIEDQISSGQPLTVTNGNTNPRRYFISIPEAAMAAMYAGATGYDGEVFIASFGDEVRISDLIQRIVAYHRAEGHVRYRYVAPRIGDLPDQPLIDAGDKKIAQDRGGVQVIPRKKLSAPTAGHIENFLREIAEGVAAGDPGIVWRALCALIPEYAAQQAQASAVRLPIALDAV